MQINSAQKHSGKYIQQDVNTVNLTGHIIKCFEVSKCFFIYFFVHVTSGVASEINTALLTFLSFLDAGMICHASYVSNLTGPANTFTVFEF